MRLPVVRHDVARQAVSRILDVNSPLADVVERMQDENPEFLRTVNLVASNSNVNAVDCLFIATFCYHLLLCQAEVDELEVMAGGSNTPAALR